MSVNTDIETSMAIVISVKNDTYRLLTKQGFRVIVTFKKFDVSELVEIHQLVGNGMMVNCEKVDF